MLKSIQDQISLHNNTLALHYTLESFLVRSYVKEARTAAILGN